MTPSLDPQALLREPAVDWATQVRLADGRLVSAESLCWMDLERFIAGEGPSGCTRDYLHRHCSAYQELSRHYSDPMNVLMAAGRVYGEPVERDRGSYLAPQLLAIRYIDVWWLPINEGLYAGWVAA